MIYKLKIIYNSLFLVRINVSLVILMIFITLVGCNGCSKSGIRDKQNDKNYNTNSKNRGQINTGKNIVKMEKVNSVYNIPIEVNDVKMYFIFDTGAGIISISETEAMFLWKQGSLTEDDILGKANFIDANGDISEGTIINLKTVKIGNKTIYNIRASVVRNLNAPLLFGQSALEKFGKISIDNNKGEITFE